MIAPVYDAEVAPTSCRGSLISFPEVFIFGVLLGFVSNYAFAVLSLKLGWRLMLGIGAVPSIFLAIGVLAMPESPQWLVLQGRLGDAKNVLLRTSDSPEEAQLRFADIKVAAGLPENCNDDVVTLPIRSHDEDVWKEQLLHPTSPVLHIPVTAIGIHLFQQARGVDTVLTYSPRIYAKAGMNKDSDKLPATIADGASKTMFILVATFLADRVGQPVTPADKLRSNDGIPNGTCRWINHNPPLQRSNNYMGSCSIGMGPIAWVYSSEIFPLRLRARGCSIVVAVNPFTSGVGLMTDLYITFQNHNDRWGILFIQWNRHCGWGIFCTLLPETHGRTLEEMEALYVCVLSWF